MKDEPVAWLYQSKINPNLPECLTRQPPDRVIEVEQFDIQPLYTIQADAAAQIAELKEELNERAADMAYLARQHKEQITKLEQALKVADEGRNYANEMLQMSAVDIAKLNKRIDKVSKRSRERAEELDLLRTQVRELRHNRDMLMEYLERECGDKCNAEYNPCNARFLLNKMMDYEVKK